MTARRTTGSNPGTNWTTQIPPIAGTLPGGSPLNRTDPSGNPTADIAILGVYPALTRQRRFTVNGTPMNLPVEVEAVSFDPGSASGAEIDDNYLTPLGLTRDDVYIFDLVPYFLANITKSPSGRSMADNVRLYEEAEDTITGIVTRPTGEDFLRYVKDLPGNLERLRDYLETCQPKLLLTLGTEPAAFVKGMCFGEASRKVDALFYSEPVEVEILGVRVRVVHLVHPHLFIKKNKKWMGRHREWCEGAGRGLADLP